MIWQILVPLVFLLSVLNQEKLFLHRSIQTEALICRANAAERVTALLGQCLRIGKSQRITLIHRIATWCTAEIQIAATRHNRPVVRCRTLTIFLIVGVIEVGQTKHMTELVADGADTIENGRILLAVKLYRAGIASQSDTILDNLPVPASTRRVIDRTGMRPQQLTVIIARRVGTSTSEDKVDHIDLTVTITVVLTEIHLTVNLVKDVTRQLGSIVRFIDIVLTTIDLTGTHHVELGREHTVRVIIEIVAHTACETTIAAVVVARIVHLVGHAVNNLRIIGTQELLIRILHQHY